MSARDGGAIAIVPSVKGMSLKVSPNGRYFVDQDGPAERTGQRENGPIKGPLRQSRNPNYLEDATGTPLILCGSHTWNTLQDWGTDGTTRPLDFDAFVKFLTAHGHNFTLLWSVELPRFRGLPSLETSPPDFWVDPFPWLRTGPGLATDGRPRFDLTKFNQAYFDQLRTRVQALSKAGIYAIGSPASGFAPWHESSLPATKSTGYHASRPTPAARRNHSPVAGTF